MRRCVSSSEYGSSKVLGMGLTVSFPTQSAGEEFYMWIGQCIAEWANVDDALFEIFRECVGPYDQCAIIYYRLPGLDIRFGLTDEIVRSVLPEPEKPKEKGGHDHVSVVAWTKTIKGYQDLLAVRRRIAHHPVDVRIGFAPELSVTSHSIGNFKYRANIFPNPRSWFELYVGKHEQLRDKSAGLKSLLLKDLKDHFEGVRNLRGRLLVFLHDVLKKTRPGPPQKPPTQA